MAVATLAFELAGAFLLAAGMLWKYGNLKKSTPGVVLAVFIAWYFSLCIVTVLPNDVSATFYRQCLSDSQPVSTTAAPLNSTDSPADFPEIPNSQNLQNEQNIQERPIYSKYQDYDVYGKVRKRRELVSVLEESSQTPALVTDDPSSLCIKPVSYVDGTVIPRLYRVVYWTTQLFTWLLIPFLSAYVQAGEFSVLAKAKTALIDNAIYYGIYVLIIIVLLIYALAAGLFQDQGASALKQMAIQAANTWGLFLLVLLLGYGLVELPRSYWHRSSIQHQLEWEYFSLAKVTEDKHEATEELNLILIEVKKASKGVPFGHVLRKHVNTILKKCPAAFQEEVAREEAQNGPNEDLMPSERTLIRLHKKLNKALQRENRTQTQFKLFLQRALYSEDVIKNRLSADRIWKCNYSTDDNTWLPASFKWWWRCIFSSHVMKALSILFALFSAMVIWSECTFSLQNPTLSIFAILVRHWASVKNYFNLELFCFITIAYLCLCAYWTLFQIKLFNIYYIAPNHHTDDYSLLFIGMFLCRLTPPLCLNFLCLIHMDSGVTDGAELVDVAYTDLSGHLSLISDRFFIYFPILIVLLCTGTYFKLGTRCLSSIGFAQFLQSDELTTDLMEEGKAFVNREKRRIERETKKDERNYNERGTTSSSAQNESFSSSNWDRVNDNYKLDNDSGDDQWDSGAKGSSSSSRPNRSLFDDV